MMVRQGHAAPHTDRAGDTHMIDIMTTVIALDYGLDYTLYVTADDVWSAAARVSA